MSNANNSRSSYFQSTFNIVPTNNFQILSFIDWETKFFINASMVAYFIE